MAKYAASQLGWPKVAKTRAWTSCTQQSAAKRLTKITQEGETPKCSGMAYKETSKPLKIVTFKNLNTSSLLKLETNA